MPRFRTCLVGREQPCDVRLDHDSVSRRHAEVVRLSDGRLFVTDRASRNGTFVRTGDDWRAVRQTYLQATDHVRFGACAMTAAQLQAHCPSDGGDATASVKDRLENPVRDPETGELMEGVRRGNARSVGGSRAGRQLLSNLQRGKR